jgi:hypothetical protein
MGNRARIEYDLAGSPWGEVEFESMAEWCAQEYVKERDRADKLAQELAELKAKTAAPDPVTAMALGLPPLHPSAEPGCTSTKVCSCCGMRGHTSVLDELEEMPGESLADKVALKVKEYLSIEYGDYGPVSDPVKDLLYKVRDRFTVREFLALDIPYNYRLTGAFRKEVLSNRILRLFAVACATRALSRVENPDPRSVKALDVAQRYADGKASITELKNTEKHARRAYSVCGKPGDELRNDAAGCASWVCCEDARSAAQSTSRADVGAAAYEASHRAPNHSAYTAYCNAEIKAYAEQVADLLRILDSEKVK